MRTGVGVVAAVIAAAAGAASAHHQPSAARLAIEKEMRDQVAAASAEAAAQFDEANEARDAGELERAAELYQKAAELAPDSDHPRRRACTMLSELGRSDQAYDLCDEALSLEPKSAYNLSAMALVLARRAELGDASQAADLARKAAELRPEDIDVVSAWCLVAIETRSERELRRCAPRILAIDPDGGLSNYVNALTAAQLGNLPGARHHLDRARAAGLDEETYQQLAGLIESAGGDGAAASSSSTSSSSVLRISLWVAGAWFAGLVALFLAGFILSRLTLRAANRVAASGDVGGHGSSGEQTLRRIYRVVVLLSGVWFYLSLPILLVSIVVVGGSLIWLFVSMGYIPIKGVLLVGLIVVVTVGAVLRGLFFRAEPGELGYKVDLGNNPRLRDLLGEVARVVGTRPVDSAYLTPSTDMAVTERGGLWKAVSGASRERCLIMGVGLLDGMRQIELRSILAHEHGHFRNQDTAGGGFALAVRRSLIVMIVRLAQAGANTWYNPVWLALRLFHRVYLVVTQGASRLQEVLADRWAIGAYGSEAFIRGYTHVVERSVRFDRHVDATLHEVIEAERPLPNLYRYQPAPAPDADQDAEAEIASAMEQEPTAFDSHPAPRQRLAWAAALAVDREPQPDDDLPAWDLFSDREALEARMTAEIREAIAANQGIAIGG